MHRIFRVFHPEPIDHVKQAVWLSPEATHHLKHVLRLPEGASVNLFDGYFLGVYPATLRYQEHGRKIKAIFNHPPIPDRSAHTQPLSLGQAQLKREAWHQILQHGTELGVSEFIPIRSQRSQPYFSSVQQVAGKRVIYGACEQSGRNQIPKLLLGRTLAAWANEAFEGVQLYCTLAHGISIRQLPCSLDQPIRLLIGPEGGLTEDEELLLNQREWIGISLGPYILRAATASLVAVALIQEARRSS